MNSVLNLFKTEPAVVTSSIMGVVVAGLILATSFGVPITTDQIHAIVTFVAAALALVGLIASGVIIRSQVTPTASLPPVGTPGYAAGGVLPPAPPAPPAA